MFASPPLSKSTLSYKHLIFKHPTKNINPSIQFYNKVSLENQGLSKSLFSLYLLKYINKVI